jgi:DNA-binding transcriptional MocR family regulator
MAEARADYDAYAARGLALNMQRGQPSDADLALSDGLLLAVTPQDVMTDSGLDVRNYSTGACGLPEARDLFGAYLEVPASQIVVWNNASLELQAHVLTMLLLRGSRRAGPWVGSAPTIIVTVPGYDRHFTLLSGLGFDLVTVDMRPDGPDVDAIEALVAADPSIRGLLFVPTYSNPGGETISPDKARRLASLNAASPDFTILADDAYRAHHLDPDAPDATVNFVRLCEAAGHPDRAYVFASTSKITFAGAGLGFVATSEENVGALAGHLGRLSIGPNKVEQWRHVRFLMSFPGGIEALMAQHAAHIAPKFEAVNAVLSERLEPGTATWSRPRGGYFISLDTTEPVADRVVQLASAAGVSLTPAGATYPAGSPHDNRNIRLAPTRPELAEVRLAMEVVAASIRLATEDYRAGR